MHLVCASHAGPCRCPLLLLPRAPLLLPPSAAAGPEVPPLPPLVRSSAPPDGPSLSSWRYVGLIRFSELPSREASSALHVGGEGWHC